MQPSKNYSLSHYLDAVDDIPCAVKTKILSTVEEAYSKAEKKHHGKLSDGQPALEFLQEVRVFDPRHIAFTDDRVSSYKAIPGFSKVPRDELDAYLTNVGPAALRATVGWRIWISSGMDFKRDFLC